MKKTRKKRVERTFPSAEVCKASNACARGRFYVVSDASTMRLSVKKQAVVSDSPSIFFGYG
mgnify:CR=1 FL=1